MKIITGKVLSVQPKTALVEVVRTVTHPLYKKLLHKTKKYQADTTEVTPKVGDMVDIVETRPIAKNKYFKIKEIKKV